MWGYVIVALGAAAVLGGLAFNVWGVAIIVVGAIALLAGLWIAVGGGAATATDAGEGEKPSWLRKRWYQ